ncbi:UNVERIFIED_CONTAM: hypothetical protein FKN15_055871 [Acipenser sinensis]
MVKRDRFKDNPSLSDTEQKEKHSGGRTRAPVCAPPDREFQSTLEEEHVLPSVLPRTGSFKALWRKNTCSRLCSPGPGVSKHSGGRTRAPVCAPPDREFQSTLEEEHVLPSVLPRTGSFKALWRKNTCSRLCSPDREFQSTLEEEHVLLSVLPGPGVSK